jgi:translation initiation factor IF-3
VHRNLATAAKGKKQADDILNAGIPASEMRVVYTDPATQKDAWKIMSKQEALQLAQAQKLDLILGSVCVP